jgi:hypothetical protein
MKYLITERQYKIITEQSDSVMDKRANGILYSTGMRNKKEFEKTNKFIDDAQKSIDPHTLMTILAIGTAFIPVAGPFISVGIGLADAALYYKEGDKKTAGLTAVFSMLPFISKIPGVKQLGTKGMALLGSKLAKGVKSFSQSELEILNSIKQNESLINQGLTEASTKLTPIVGSVKSLKPNFISKFGQQRYDELLEQFITGKLSKEGFLKNLNSASGNTSKMAKWTVQGGIKFAQSELKSITDLVPYIKNGDLGWYNIKLNVNGVIKNVEVVVGNFANKSWEGLAVGRDKIYMNMSKLEKATEQEIRQILYHEATHIKDPSLVSSKLNQSYNNIADKVQSGNLYQRYLYHPQEIIANNQMVLNNMTSELDGVVQKFGHNQVKTILDNLVGYTSGKNVLSKEALDLLGKNGVEHLNGLYKYNKKYYLEFLKKVAKQSEYLKSQLNLLK